LLSFAPLISRLTWMEEPLYQTIAYIVTTLGILMIFTAKHFGTVIDKSIQNKFALSQVRSDLESTKGQLFTLLENAPIGIFYYNSDLRVTDLNGRLLRDLRLDDRDSLLGFNLNHATDTRIHPALEKALKNKEGYYKGAFFSPFEERTLYVELLTVPIADQENEVNGAICFFKDQTAEMEAKATLHQNAFYDPLTKLPNRILFGDRLHLAIEQSKRHRFRCAVLLLDLDHFKSINDNLGHHIGDRLLYQVSERLLQHVRSEDTVARIEGDEFLILLNALTYNEEVAKRITMEIAEGLIESINEQYRIDTHEIAMTASIGAFVFSGEEYENPNRIIKHADVAMYQAKKTGRNNAQMYHWDFERSQQELAKLDKELRRALEQNEFRVYYQPKVDIRSGKVKQAEALIRWIHPQKGLVSPDNFIPYAEESGLILKIGEWVMDACMQQIKLWRETDRDLPVECIAVNVSTHQFNQPDFVEQVQMMIAKYAIPPSTIELELTESVLLEDSTNAIDKIKSLERSGIRMTLDDFGTGYSSLSYLKDLPVSTIKIDRSFVTDLKHSQSALMIVKTIISIAKNLGLNIVAEGVEAEEELAVLKELECDYYQGYYCGKAMAAAEFTEFLDTKCAV
ncbi:MAG: EAL domain-containing protein, partial [Campylobacterales bacterium]